MNVFPTQPLAPVGVITYVTSCVVAVTLVRVSTMLLEPDPSPATFAFAVAAHAYVTPVMPLLTSASFNTTVNATSEHEFAVPATPTGSDLTVTV